MPPPFPYKIAEVSQNRDNPIIEIVQKISSPYSHRNQINHGIAAIIYNKAFWGSTTAINNKNAIAKIIPNDTINGEQNIPSINNARILASYKNSCHCVLSFIVISLPDKVLSLYWT